jgi:hypothetical protein
MAFPGAVVKDGVRNFVEESVMKGFRAVAVAALMLSAISSWAASDAQKALDRFKLMEGTWVGKGAHGETSEVKYRVKP